MGTTFTPKNKLSNWPGREYSLQEMVTSFIKSHFADLMYFHVPNEGKHHVNYRNKQIRMGMRDGVSDVIILDQTVTGFKGLVMELKVGRNKPTPAQEQFLNDMLARGYVAGWANSYEEATAIIYKHYNK